MSLRRAYYKYDPPAPLGTSRKQPSDPDKRLEMAQALLRSVGELKSDATKQQLEQSLRKFQARKRRDLPQPMPASTERKIESKLGSIVRLLEEQKETQENNATLPGRRLLLEADPFNEGAEDYAFNDVVGNIEQSEDVEELSQPINKDAYPSLTSSQITRANRARQQRLRQVLPTPYDTSKDTGLTSGEDLFETRGTVAMEARPKNQVFQQASSDLSFESTARPNDDDRENSDFDDYDDDPFIAGDLSAIKANPRSSRYPNSAPPGGVDYKREREVAPQELNFTAPARIARLPADPVQFTYNPDKPYEEMRAMRWERGDQFAELQNSLSTAWGETFNEAQPVQQQLESLSQPRWDFEDKWNKAKFRLSQDPQSRELKTAADKIFQIRLKLEAEADVYEKQLDAIMARGKGYQKRIEQLKLKQAAEDEEYKKYTNILRARDIEEADRRRDAYNQENGIRRDEGKYAAAEPASSLSLAAAADTSSSTTQELPSATADTTSSAAQDQQDPQSDFEDWDTTLEELDNDADGQTFGAFFWGDPAFAQDRKDLGIPMPRLDPFKRTLHGQEDPLPTNKPRGTLEQSRDRLEDLFLKYFKQANDLGTFGIQRTPEQQKEYDSVRNYALEIGKQLNKPNDDPSMQMLMRGYFPPQQDTKGLSAMFNDKGDVVNTPLNTRSRSKINRPQTVQVDFRKLFAPYKDSKNPKAELRQDLDIQVAEFKTEFDDLTNLRIEDVLQDERGAFEALQQAVRKKYAREIVPGEPPEYPSLDPSFGTEYKKDMQKAADFIALVRIWKYKVGLGKVKGRGKGKAKQPKQRKRVRGRYYLESGGMMKKPRRY